MAPKQTDPQFKLRMTPEIKEAIEAAAAANNRSMNAEILSRLDDSFSTHATDEIIELDEQLTKAEAKIDVLKEMLLMVTVSMPSTPANEETFFGIRNIIQMIENDPEAALRAKAAISESRSRPRGLDPKPKDSNASPAQPEEPDARGPKPNIHAKGDRRVKLPETGAGGPSSQLGAPARMRKETFHRK
ncbi:hypothetical protein DEM27_10330 [Metarhizobium album]|uniref:Arc-like DNA binding domain-containing protein n=1 Tax=Metarhizobium album TaxID=2182425 RepID=A0A2U2DU66_9HYPH|nr:Arc family DNA-binding protein [Rhizobium album]PWE56846.1 hypothetical protein DEM27_10330 [Rhizobium album]